MQHANTTKCSTFALLAFGAGLGLAAALSPAFADPKEAGVWYDDTGKGAVKIEVCTSTTLCGHIYWLKDPLNSKGKPLTDGHNPDESLRKRPICGLPVLGDLEQTSDGGFDNGWVYDPKVGQSYSVALDLVSPTELKVTGYKGMRFLGKSFIWTRAPDDLPSCSSNSAAAPDAGSDTKHPNASGSSKLGAADAPPKHKKKAAARTATPPPPVASN